MAEDPNGESGRIAGVHWGLGVLALMIIASVALAHLPGEVGRAPIILLGAIAAGGGGLGVSVWLGLQGVRNRKWRGYLLAWGLAPWFALQAFEAVVAVVRAAWGQGRLP